MLAVSIVSDDAGGTSTVERTTAFIGLLLAVAIMIAGGVTAFSRLVSADVQGTPHLELDMDPTNGTRPCSPIDATRTGAPTSGTYQIAVCLHESAGSPGDP